MSLCLQVPFWKDVLQVCICRGEDWVGGDSEAKPRLLNNLIYIFPQSLKQKYDYVRIRWTTRLKVPACLCSKSKAPARITVTAAVKSIDIDGWCFFLIVLRQTNVFPTAQKRKIRGFLGFNRRAVVICPTDEDLQLRTQKREREEGKDVPDSAVLEMKGKLLIKSITANLTVSLVNHKNLFCLFFLSFSQLVVVSWKTLKYQRYFSLKFRN